MEVLVFAGLIVVGFFVGVCDLVAGGGNLITVAALGLLSLPALSAVATVKLVAVAQNLLSSLIFERDRLIHWRPAFIFTPFAVIGSFWGAKTAVNIDQRLLSYLVGGLMLVILFLVPGLKDKEEISLSRFIQRLFKGFQRKKPAMTASRQQTLVLMLFSLIVGFYGGFHGGGVGVIMLLGFYFLGQAKLLATAATTKVIDIFMSLTALYIFSSRPGLIKWRLALPIILGAAVGSLVSLSWTKKFGLRYIKVVMYLVVVSSAVKFLLLP